MLPIQVPVPEAPGKWTLSFETGAVFQTQNTVRVPNSGSSVNLRDLLGSSSRAYYRVQGLYRQSEDQGFRFVIAPLTLSGDGNFTRPISFDGQAFSAGLPTHGEYQFNSYRVSYWRRARAPHGENWRFGYTLKVRDARVTLKQSATRASSYNLGIVPLLHFSGEKSLGEKTKLWVDFDGLVAPQGRALDLGLQVSQSINSKLEVFAGYRVLEGGADVDQTFNTALFQYLSVGVRVRF